MYETHYLITLVISWSIVVPILLYIIRNLYIKNNIYEAWVVDTRNTVSDISDDIKDIDSKELFENDDEVGIVYTGIRDLVLELDSKIKEEDI